MKVFIRFFLIPPEHSIYNTYSVLHLNKSHLIHKGKILQLPVHFSFFQKKISKKKYFAPPEKYFFLIAYCD